MRRLVALSLLEQQQRSSSELLEGVSWACRPDSFSPRDNEDDPQQAATAEPQESSGTLLFAGL